MKSVVPPELESSSAELGREQLGLSSAQAAIRLREVGPNRLPQPRRRGLLGRVSDQLRDPMILLLMGAATLTATLHDWPDTVIIAMVVVFNTAAGVVQQFRAERAMTALHLLTAPVAHVSRDRELVEIPAEEVVPGDLVHVNAGDVVPADGWVVVAKQLQVNEANMTGESLPVDLHEEAELTGGTLVTRGRATMLVSRTGQHSGIGRIASMLAYAGSRPTPLQRRLARLSRLLVALVLSLTAVVVASGLMRGRPLAEMVVVGLSLAVAAVPESLPAVVTVALAMGAHRMAGRNAVIRDLPAVETLGSVSVVATDKTGTITEGTMLAERLWTPAASYTTTGTGYAPTGTIDRSDEPDDNGREDLVRLLRDIALCNDARLREADGDWIVQGDPLEGALLALAAKGGSAAESWQVNWPRIDEEPFDHRTLRMTTHHIDVQGRHLTVCKGAPEALLGLLVPTDGTVRAHAVADELAAAGYRVLAVADKASDSVARTEELELVGLVAIGDPPRRHAPGVVDSLRKAGIRVVLVTGDHPGTAEAIARRVGIADADDHSVDGTDLANGDSDYTDVVLRIVSRVQPEQKVFVVEALQEQGDVVAMLGDGVNDAPALRHADIGVAAGRGGSEVAKQAADLVLLDDDLSTVVAAVQEGRRIFANIRIFLIYALSGGLAEVGVMLAGPAIGLVLPLLPAQILWINLLTHGLTGVAFGAEPADPADMFEPPRPASESIFGERAKLLVAVAAVALTASALVAGSLVSGATPERRTAVFLALGFGQLCVALALRARAAKRRVKERGLELAVLAAASLLLAAVYLAPLQDLLGTVALPRHEVALALACAALPAVIVRVLARHRGLWARPVVTSVGTGP
jgi:Ca2+-transporting ATPase